MKTSTRLDSVVFQLTPTRTRCDLVITANGRTEKIASGLLNPFLAHLKAAQEQIGKGGYSIILEPNCGSNAAWFTKGTVERFVRFVSTPEILERVYTIESEILQIEKAISLQNNNYARLHISEDLQAKSEESIGASKSALVGNEEKAIVLYEPVSHQSEADGSTMQEGNSKVQLVRVLETRKTVLQKEQGMAFARAVAASFDIDNIAALISFAECFGASRMMEACKKFVALWKAKHESGQWVEVEAPPAISCRFDSSSMNASGIMFVGSDEPRECKESWPQGETAVSSEKNGISCATGGDVKPQVQPNPQDYIPVQFPHPMFPHWQMHPLPYPVQSMPYYQNYPVSGPFFPPPYAPLDDSRSPAGHSTRQRRHSMDSRDMSAESGTQDFDASGRRMHEGTDIEEEDSVNQRSRKRGGKSSKNHSGTVVIRNINYIAPAKQVSSDSDRESCSDSGTDDDEGSMKIDLTRKPKKKGADLKSGQVGDDGHWQAFQNFLLKDADESNDSMRSDMFAMEGKARGRKRQTFIKDASSVFGGRNMGANRDGEFGEHHDVAGDMTCMRKQTDEQMLSYGRVSGIDSRTDIQFMQEEGRRGVNRRPADTNMDYMISRHESLTDVWDSSLDPVIANGLQGSSNNDNKGSSHGMADESFIIPQRSVLSDQVAVNGGTVMDVDYELPSRLQKAENRTVGARNQSNYEPNVLNLMPDRVVHDGPSGYDPALDYEMQAQVKGAANVSGKKKEVTTDAKGGPKKVVKDQNLKAEKKITAGTRREKPKLSPSEHARARAEKLRAYKADLEKLKKEKEEEQRKRLEALKKERQKRIAARSGANAAQLPLPSQQAKKSLPKLSPVSHKGSKFSDAEPGSSSPLQRSTLRFVSKVSPDSGNASKSGRSNNGGLSSGNKLTRSASALSVRKEEKSDSKATMMRIRRLSEPKKAIQNISSGKRLSAEAMSRKRESDGPEMKKTPATVNLDKTKFAAHPELKLRASKGPSVSRSQKPNEKKLSSAATSSTNTSVGNANMKSPSDGDDSTVVDKTVVVLECEKPSILPHVSEDKSSIRQTQSDAYNSRGKTEDLAIPPPASPIVVKEVNQELSDGRVKGQSTSCSYKIGAEKTLSNVDNVGNAQKPYHAPHARVSSLEDMCMANMDYGRATPTILETTAAHVFDNKQQNVIKISEAASGKHHEKEAKGIKRLLKFGKKNSATNESNFESDKASPDGSVVDDNALNGSSSEVFTLKNLLSQEESSSAGTTPKKSSRSFSLLSPFRSKTSEKKMST